MGLDARLVSFAFACLPVLCCSYFLLQKNQVITIFLRPEEIMGGEKKTNGRQMDTRANSTKNITGGQASSCA